MTMNGASSGYVVPSTVTWFSAIASRSADCVFGDARLISSPRRMLAKIGPARNWKSPEARLYTLTPTTSDGSRSGVNCTRPKVHLIDVAIDFARLVLPTPGTSSISRWPSDNRHSSASWMTSTLPWITRSTFSTIALNEVANDVPSSAGCCRDIRERLGRMATRFALAIDIGGTKVAAGVVDDQGRLLARHERPTPDTDDPEDMWATVVSAIADTGGHHADVCGVGCGGPMRRDLVSPLNIRAWRDFPLRDRLEQHLGLPVAVDNDAKALALGEGWVGAAAGERNYLAMVVSTGVGGGIVLDGRLLDGEDGNAGHIGHVIVEPDGHLCGCGARGCVEAEASGTAIRAISGRPPVDASTAVRMRTGTLVGRAVSSVANLLDLRLAVVAGSVALGYGDVFFRAAQAEIDLRAQLAFSRGTKVVPGA